MNFLDSTIILILMDLLFIIVILFIMRPFSAFVVLLDMFIFIIVVAFFVMNFLFNISILFMMSLFCLIVNELPLLCGGCD